MNKTGTHIGTGLGISPNKVLSTASNYLKYIETAGYEDITVFNIKSKIHHNILTIEPQENFTASLANDVSVITVSHLTNFCGCLHFRIINLLVNLHFEIFI